MRQSLRRLTVGLGTARPPSPPPRQAARWCVDEVCTFDSEITRGIRGLLLAAGAKLGPRACDGVVFEGASPSTAQGELAHITVCTREIQSSAYGIEHPVWLDDAVAACLTVAAPPSGARSPRPPAYVTPKRPRRQQVLSSHDNGHDSTSESSSDLPRKRRPADTPMSGLHSLFSLAAAANRRHSGFATAGLAVACKTDVGGGWSGIREALASSAAAEEHMHLAQVRGRASLHNLPPPELLTFFLVRETPRNDLCEKKRGGVQRVESAIPQSGGGLGMQPVVMTTAPLTAPRYAAFFLSRSDCIVRAMLTS